MIIEIPANGLIALGQCSASCLLALDPDGDCDCHCRGRYHSAAATAAIRFDTAWRVPVSVSAVTPESAPTPHQSTERDLLADLDEVLGGESVPAAVVPRLLVELAPGWLPYRSLNGKRLRAQLARLGITVPSTDNKYPIRPLTVRRALARRTEKEKVIS